MTSTLTFILLRLRCFSLGSLSLILLILSSTSVVFGGSNGTAFNDSAFATPIKNHKLYMSTLAYKYKIQEKQMHFHNDSQFCKKWRNCISNGITWSHIHSFSFVHSFVCSCIHSPGFSQGDDLGEKVSLIWLMSPNFWAEGEVKMYRTYREILKLLPVRQL